MSVDVDALRKRLKATECPAFWGLDRLECKRVGSMIDKLEEKNEEIAGQLWRNIVLDLAISYEYMKMSVIPICSQKLADCLTWVDNSDDHNFIRKYEASFRHLILSFKAFIALEKGDHSEALRSLNNIVDLSKMKKTQLAAVYGLKSNVFTEYGVGGTREAFVWARKALELDNSEPEWYFLLGKLHSRQRNYCIIHHPCQEENECLEKAYKMNQKAHTAVYLATSYKTRAREIAIRQPVSAGKRNWDPRAEVEAKKYSLRALELYREAMVLNDGQCLHIMARCAYGFASLPDEFRNTQIALELAEKILKKSNSNIMAHSILCIVYRDRRELTAAIAHGKKAAYLGAFGAQMMLLNLYQSGKKEFDITTHVARILKYFPLDIYRTQLYSYASNYFLFVKRDLFKSLPYFEKALELDPQFNLLKEQYVRWAKVILNIFELMYNEIECALRKESYVNENERKALLKIRDKIAAAWPVVTDMVIVKDLVNKLKENASSFMRARACNRKNIKGANSKKRKKGKTDPRRRLKSSQSVSAHSKDDLKSGRFMRSSSDDRFYNNIRPTGDFGSSEKRKYQNKRALSQDGRSQSRDCPKKILKEMEKIRQSIENLSLPGLSLRPDSSIDAIDNLSQLSLNKESTPREIPVRKQSNYFSKRSVSFDRQNVPQKRISAVVTPSKQLTEKDSFFPDFKTPSSVKQYESLTVENVEKFKNSVRRGSLDSDDTLESQMSNLSLRPSSNVGVCSATSVSVTTNRSLSLDDCQRSVSTGVEKEVKGVQETTKVESTDWAMASENYVSPYEIDLTPGRKERPQKPAGPSVKGRSSKCVGLVESSHKPAWSNQTNLTQHMRDLSLENKQPKAPRHSDVVRSNVGEHQRGGYSSGYPRGGGSNRGGYGDRRSPFGREPLAGGRVLRPPGAGNPRRRADSATSTSSADSDYVGSRWGKSNAASRYTR